MIRGELWYQWLCGSTQDCLGTEMFASIAWYPQELMPVMLASERSQATQSPGICSLCMRRNGVLLPCHDVGGVCLPGLCLPVKNWYARHGDVCCRLLLTGKTAVLCSELGIAIITLLKLFSDSRHPDPTAASKARATDVAFMVLSCGFSLASFCVSVVGVGRLWHSLRNVAQRLSAKVVPRGPHKSSRPQMAGFAVVAPVDTPEVRRVFFFTARRFTLDL